MSIEWNAVFYNEIVLLMEWKLCAGIYIKLRNLGNDFPNKINIYWLPNFNPLFPFVILIQHLSLGQSQVFRTKFLNLSAAIEILGVIIFYCGGHLCALHII